jgi:hypothetical protein
MTTKAHTVGQRVRQLLASKRQLTYDEIARQVRREIKTATTSKDSVQWYASRMRAEGAKPNVRLFQ